MKHLEEDKKRVEEDKKRVEEELVKISMEISAEEVKNAEVARALKDKDEKKKKS